MAVTTIGEAVRRRPLHVVVIPAEVVVYWRAHDPHEWQLVLEWLTTMGVEVDVS
jgi:hypothetical protein